MLPRVLTIGFAVLLAGAGADLAGRVVLGRDLVAFAAPSGASSPNDPPAPSGPAPAVAAPAAPAPVIDVACDAGRVVVRPVAPWRVNVAAPWKWERNEQLSRTSEEVRFRGDRCEGVVHAYVCADDRCRNVRVAVR